MGDKKLNIYAKLYADMLELADSSLANVALGNSPIAKLPLRFVAAPLPTKSLQANLLREPCLDELLRSIYEER